MLRASFVVIVNPWSVFVLIYASDTEMPPPGVGVGQALDRQYRKSEMVAEWDAKRCGVGLGEG